MKRRQTLTRREIMEAKIAPFLTESLLNNDKTGNAPPKNKVTKTLMISQER